MVGGAWGQTDASAYLQIHALPFSTKEKLYFYSVYFTCVKSIASKYHTNSSTSLFSIRRKAICCEQRGLRRGPPAERMCGVAQGPNVWIGFWCSLKSRRSPLVRTRQWVHYSAFYILPDGRLPVGSSQTCTLFQAFQHPGKHLKQSMICGATVIWKIIQTGFFSFSCRSSNYWQEPGPRLRVNSLITAWWAGAF